MKDIYDFYVYAYLRGVGLSSFWGLCIYLMYETLWWFEGWDFMTIIVIWDNDGYFYGLIVVCNYLWCLINNYSVLVTLWNG